jgi:hypothetical protein
VGAKLAAGHVPPLLKPLAAWGARSVVLPRTVAHLCLWRRFGKPTPAGKFCAPRDCAQGTRRRSRPDRARGARTHNPIPLSPDPSRLAAHPLRAALEAAGVEFTPENGSGPGVRLRKNKKGARFDPSTPGSGFVPSVSEARRRACGPDTNPYPGHPELYRPAPQRRCDFGATANINDCSVAKLPGVGSAAAGLKRSPALPNPAKLSAIRLMGTGQAARPRPDRQHSTVPLRNDPTALAPPGALIAGETIDQQVFPLVDCEPGAGWEHPRLTSPDF